MINSEIKITCPDCKRQIKINVKSIIDLQEENNKLKKRLENLQGGNNWDFMEEILKLNKGRNK